MKWSYGVTTHPNRRRTLLPKTLTSLKEAGFDQPRLFVDGINLLGADDYEVEFGLHVTPRNPPVRAFANWALGLAELYVREPHADRYAIFQDDLVAVKNLRQYLEQVNLTDRQYWNLMTFPPKHQPAPPSPNYRGFYSSQQLGRSAVGLVFTRAGVQQILQSASFVIKPMDPHRGWRTIDGAVCQALIVGRPDKDRWTELIHFPSLLDHTGVDSEIQKVLDTSPVPNDRNRIYHKLRAESFPGENYNALDLLRQA